MSETGEVELVCKDLNAALELLRLAGMRLDVIYPADEPHTALLTMAEQRVRLTTSPNAPPPSDELPLFRPEFLLTRSSGTPGEGRAGMLYRDLIPGRLGGRYIASHITIPDGGPVSDWVHFHRIALQLIYVRRGWVRVVYEDQGDPFVMQAGDLVLQPPGIRHRVLESSPGLEVVEITCPALHKTFADHELELPNAERSDRSFGAQRFLHHVAAQATWTSFHEGEAQETEVTSASGGIAEARTIRPADSLILSFAPHDGELVFGFVLEGSGTLECRGDRSIAAADAFVIPPGDQWRITQASDDLLLLQVTTAAAGLAVTA